MGEGDVPPSRVKNCLARQNCAPWESVQRVLCLGQYEQGSSGLPGVAGSSRLAFQLSVCLSRAAPNHGAPSYPLSSLFALLESLYPVIMSPTTPSVVLQPSHTHGTAFISLVSWACPFPKAQGLCFSEFPPVCLHHPHVQGHSATQWSQRRGGVWGLQWACLFPRLH